jgi:hypothetical protein
LIRKGEKMFRIPNFYQEQVSFKGAWKTMTNFGRGDCLEGMNAINRVWEEHCANPCVHSDLDDDEFWDNYAYEANAYNVVYEGMGQLFGEAA